MEDILLDIDRSKGSKTASYTQKQIVPLLREITSSLLKNQPSDPRSFLRKNLLQEQEQGEEGSHEDGLGIVTTAQQSAKVSSLLCSRFIFQLQR